MPIVPGSRFLRQQWSAEYATSPTRPHMGQGAVEQPFRSQTETISFAYGMVRIYTDDEKRHVKA